MRIVSLYPRKYFAVEIKPSEAPVMFEKLRFLGWFANEILRAWFKEHDFPDIDSISWDRGDFVYIKFNDIKSAEFFICHWRL